MSTETVTAAVRQSLAKLSPEQAASGGSRIILYAAPFVALSAAGLGVAGLFRRGPSFLRRRPLLSGLLACGGVAALLKTQLDRFFLERPEYTLERELNGLELRCYAPRTVAETIVDAATFDEARETGFKRLAAYISGENVAEERFSMGSAPNPERGRNGHDSEHLGMASPVTLAREDKGYVMRFQMPKARSLASLPRAKDQRVVLRRIPRERLAVLKFRGTYDGALIAEKQRELLARVKAAGLKPQGEPVFAGYDSPATLPLIRRVEVWVRVA
jgi:hypothetical protein